MRKYLAFFAVAVLGGLAAIGINNIFNKHESQLFDQNYMAKYAALQDNGGRPDFVDVAQLVTPTVVHIVTTVEQPQADARGQGQADPFNFFRDHGFDFPQVNPMPRVGSGSGVIISSDGYIVTNNHVIDGASKVRVTLYDKREYTADVLGRDKNTDLALLRIDEKNLPFALIGNSDEVKVGQWVIAVGNPFNLTSTVTAGIVSAKGRGLNLINDPRRQDPDTKYAIEAFIQTDAAVNPGNSGGALVSSEGKLIGINTAIASETGQYAGYAFAIPSNLMKKVVDDLLKYGEVQRGILGVQIQDVNSQLADREGLKEVKGVFVAKIFENSAADDAGLKEKDVILSIDGEAVNSSNELQEKVGKRNPGDKVKLIVLRDGSEHEFMVTLKNKDGKSTVSHVEKIENSKLLNSEFESISRDERLRLKVSGGVRVKSVGEKSPLKKAGMPDGFVITFIDKKPVASVSELKSVLQDKKGGILVEGFKVDGSKGLYAVDLDK